MSVIHDLLEAKDPEWRRAVFCLRHDLREEWAAAKTKRNAAELRVNNPRTRDRDSGSTAAADLADAEAALDELRERIGPHLAVFQFRGIDRLEFERIRKEHRPTPPQVTEARKLGVSPPEWNTDTFAPAFISASCVKITSPSGEQDGIAEEDAQALWNSDRWNDAERLELFHTALNAYTTRTDMDGADLGKDSARTNA